MGQVKIVDENVPVYLVQRCHRLRNLPYRQWACIVTPHLCEPLYLSLDLESTVIGFSHTDVVKLVLSGNECCVPNKVSGVMKAVPAIRSKEVIRMC